MLQMGICKRAMIFFAKKLNNFRDKTLSGISVRQGRSSVPEISYRVKTGKLLLTVGSLISIGLVGSAASEPIPQSAPEICDSAVVVSSFSLTFNGLFYDTAAGTSQWDYTLIWDGTDPALSHFIIELCPDLTDTNLVASSPAGATIGFGGPTGLYGIKWDDIENFPVNTPVQYSFTLNLILDVESGQFAPKAGLNGNVTDICGPSIECETTDTCTVTLACPPDLSISCNESTDTSNTGQAVLTIIGLCPPLTLQYADSTMPGSCPQESTVYRTWQAVDEFSNVLASCVQTITITDSLPPLIVACPADITIYSLLDIPVCDSSLITAEDNCGILSIVCNRTEAGGSGCEDDPRLFIDSFTVSDECGNVAYCVRTIRLIDGGSPSILDQDFSAKLCELNVERSIQVVAAYPGGQFIFELVSGSGLIDSISGIITYVPDTAGTFLFTVAVHGACGSDTALITDLILLNGIPQVYSNDSTVSLCSVQEICFDLFASDPDGDPIQISMPEGPGTFEMISDTSGRACFIPANLDSAVYMFVFRVADSCALTSPPAPPVPECVCEDTTYITVLINQAPILECPGPQDFLACQLDTFCFDIQATDPDGDSLSFTVLSGNAWIDGLTVCVAGFDSSSFDVLIQCTDTCGNSDTCTVPVTITPNSAPYVSTGDGFDVFHCQPEQVCFGASVFDFEGNLAGITLNWGTYNPTTNTICFLADTAGQYTIIIDAEDSCGAVTSDTTVINVTVNDLPFVDLGPDFDTSMCALGEICFDVTVTDGQIKYVSSTVGYYNDSTGQLCFLPDTAGVYTIIVTAGDFCDETATDTIQITIEGQLPPEIDLGPDTSIISCGTAEICINVTTITNYQSISSNFGSYNPQTGQVCFVPDLADIYHLIVEVVDTCGAIGADTVAIDVSLGGAPIVTGMSDTTIYLCLPEPVCVPYSLIDPEGDLDTIYTSFGSIMDGQVCFLPYSSGHYQIIVTAVGSCGSISSDTAVVWIRTDQEINLQVPDDTTLFLCQHDTLCFPISGFPDDAQITVSGINSWYDASTQTVCFYSDCATTNHITVTATTQCGAYSASFVVQTLCNAAPLVFLPPDTAMFVCEASEVCFPVGISDADGNLSGVEVQGAVYDALFSRVCFTPDTSGVYSIIVKATDSCGAFRSDTMLVVVQLNEPPTCNLPGDTALFLCELSEIRLPVSVYDADNNFDSCLVTGGPGVIQDGYWVYTPSGSEDVTISIQCFDSCGATCSGQFTVSIRVNSAPVCESDIDSIFNMCTATEICIPVGATDSDLNFDSAFILSGPGTLVNGSWCYTPSGNDSVAAVIRFIDSCGAYCDQTIRAIFQVNQAPVAICPGDTSLIVEDLSEICLRGFGGLGSDSLNIQVIGGTLRGDSVCFIPTAGTNSIKLIVTDECGQSDSCEMIIDIIINTPPVCQLPNDTVLLGCDVGQIMLPVGGVDSEGNLLGCEIVSGPGELIDGYWVFTPQSAGLVTAMIRCTDSLGAFCEGSFTVDVQSNSPPVCQPDIDTTVYMCDIAVLCLPVGADDPDSNIVNIQIVSGPGELIAGSWCYTPMGEDSVTAIIRFTDSCGLYCEQSITARFELNSPPTAFCPGDTTIFACDLSDICLTGFGVNDIDGNLVSVQVIGGTLSGDTICFAPIEGLNVLTIIGADECGLVDTCRMTVTVTLNSPPVCAVPSDTSISLCLGESVCLPVDASDSDGNLSDCRVIGGPGEIVDGLWCYTPGADETVVVTIRCTDACGAVCERSFTVMIDINDPPVASDTSYAAYFCNAGETRSIQTFANDPENDVLIYRLISGAGVIDSLTGLISYIPDTSGLYSFTVGVSDLCGIDTATITDLISFNRPPQSSTYDTTIYLCSFQSICFDVYGSDPDGDPITITQIEGPGQFTMTSDSSGRSCFLPANVDSSDYRFVFCFADSCLEAQQACVFDTINVTVITNRSPEITCPTPQNFVACRLDTFCFDIESIDPDGDSLTFNIISGLASVSGNTVCVIGGSDSAFFDITLEAVDACGLADTCSFTVMIIPNSAPIVTAADNFNLSPCQPEQVCFDVAVTDYENNITSITTNLGSYNDSTGQFCFNADSSGVYTLILTATDSCGLLAADTTFVTVDMNELPTVQLPEDVAVSLCGDSLLCFDASIYDDNAVTMLLNYGSYDSAGGIICVLLDTAGIYTIIASLTDSCEITAADTLNITVSAPVELIVDLGNDSAVYLCDVAEICLPVAIPSNLISLNVQGGQYNSETGELCFTPDSYGVYTLWVEATDSCGAVAVDTVQITVTLNNRPSINMSDTTHYICLPQPLCIAVDVNDPDGNLMSVTATGGYYSNGTVCFLPYSSGHYRIIVTAVDSCGLTAIDTAYLIVETDQGVSIEVPDDTVVFACQLDTFCFPIGGIPDGAQVEVTGINTWFDSAASSVCFYSDCATTNHISVSVSTGCNTFTESFVVQTMCNSRPLVFLPPDTTLSVCDSVEICLPVGISDQDNNLSEIIVTGGWYNSTFSRVCFTPEGPGTYTIGVTAIDSCGAVGTDQIVVTVLANVPPEISYTPTDSIFRQCVTGQFLEICLPLGVSDADNNLVSVNTSTGAYDAGTGEFCFTPDTAGLYCIDIVAIDDCQARDSIRICLTVERGDFVTVQCSDSALSLCGADSICIPVMISGNYDSVITSFGTFADNQICFQADTAGTYLLSVTAFAECNIDTCTAMLDVIFIDSVDIVCPNDSSVFLCGPDTLEFQFQLLTAVDSVTVNAPAFLTGNTVSVPVFVDGLQTITLIGFGSCGVDSCSFDVQATLNVAPVVLAAEDTIVLACSLEEICIPFTSSDADGNLDSVTTSLGLIVNSQVCFLPGDFGSFEIIITAYDACHAIGVDTVVVNVVLEGAVAIICPQDQFATICGPDSVCIIAPITPSDAIVTVLPAGNYDPATGKVCVFVEQEGVQTITVIAESDCGSDTCEFDLTVTLAEVPLVSCPALLDTTVCVDKIDSICFPVDVQGTGVSVNVNPFGSFTAGLVCFPVDSAGSYRLEIIAFSECGVDTCYTTYEVFDDSPPVLTLPFDTTLIRCPGDTDLICIDGIFASDAESLFSLNMVCGDGSFDLISVDSGRVCFRPDTMGTYEFCFVANDNCSSTSGSFFVFVEEKPDCDVCVRLTIDPGECVPVGVVKNVDFNIETNGPIGGFDVLIAYDASVMTFQGTTIGGGAIDGWEYFTYRLNSGNCGNACPPGLVRFIAIADQNNGNLHPPDSTLRPNGKLFTVQFLVANDQNLGDQFLPIYFVWYDCGDNLFANDVGDKAYIDVRIFSPEMNLVWDEDDDIAFPEGSRPFGVGAPDNCIGGEKPTAPQRCIEFINGGICVIHPDTLDDRGDLNLNDVPFEIADAVLFSNYFIHGLSVFTINVPGQTAASDVNADGFTLTVADLVLLIRIIIGDAAPIGKIAPHAEQAVITDEIFNGRMSVTTETVQEIGAALFVYELKGETSVEDVRLGADAENMKLLYSVRGNALNILIFDFGRNSIGSGSNRLLDIELSGDARLVLTHNELVDYQGRPYIAAYKGPAIPNIYSLGQNYPNPFNPLTTIRFSLSHASDWSLEIFNIAGKQVRRFEGSGDAGAMLLEWDGRNESGTAVASGIYLYRLTAGEFSNTRKMILLK